MKSTYFLLGKKRFGLEECEWAGVIEYFHKWSVSVNTHTQMWISVNLIPESCSKPWDLYSEKEQQVTLEGVPLWQSDGCPPHCMCFWCLQHWWRRSWLCEGQRKPFPLQPGVPLPHRDPLLQQHIFSYFYLTLLSRKLTLRRVNIYCYMAKSSLSNVSSCYMLLHCMSYIICVISDT